MASLTVTKLWNLISFRCSVWLSFLRSRYFTNCPSLLCRYVRTYVLLINNSMYTKQHTVCITSLCHNIYTYIHHVQMLNSVALLCDIHWFNNIRMSYLLHVTRCRPFLDCWVAPHLWPTEINGAYPHCVDTPHQVQAAGGRPHQAVCGTENKGRWPLR